MGGRAAFSQEEILNELRRRVLRPEAWVVLVTMLNDEARQLAYELEREDDPRRRELISLARSRAGIDP
jgi:hypothetical protein